MTFVLADHQHVHFVGIGGIGMSALARLLLVRGYTVSGSDRQWGEQQEALARDFGADVRIGHSAKNVEGADLVVITSAVHDDNPEVQAALARGIPIVKRSQLLASVMNPAHGIAVAGTHGKTTTSALIGHIVAEAGLDPTILIGGISHNLGSNARVGKGDIVVVEADEYDASFLHLRPEIAVITNVEPDHLDFYGTVENVHAAFREFATKVRGTLVICSDDSILSGIATHAGSSGSAVRVVTYGIGGGDWRASRIVEDGERTRFSVRRDGREAEFSTTLAGDHNVRNALAALAVGHVLAIPDEVVAASMASFAGVGRRFERKGEAAGVLVLDDYAHHPTEIHTNLVALKARFGRPVRLIFQPHTYSRTHSFLDDFARSFSDADAVYLMDIYAARETDALGISGESLANAARAHHGSVRYTRTAEATLAAVLADVLPGDLVITMGAGDVNALGPAILQRLARRAARWDHSQKVPR